MPSRQVVPLTPLESSHPLLSPSRHRINLMNTDFPVGDPSYFQTFTGAHFATHLFSHSCRDGGGYTPLPVLAPILDLWTFRPLDLWTLRRLVSPLSATFTKHAASVASKGLTPRLIPLDATLTKNRGECVPLRTFNLPTCKPSNVQLFLPRMGYN